MALKNEYLNECPLRSLVTSGGELWTATPSGANEYFYNEVTELTVEPLNVLEGGSTMTRGILDNLTGGDWDWDLINKRLVVKLSDGSDPDTKATDYLKCSEPITIFQAAGAKETIILSVLLSNTEDVDVNTVLYVINAFDTLKAAFLIDISKADSYNKWSEKIVLECGDKLQLMANMEKVNVLVSLDES